MTCSQVCVVTVVAAVVAGTAGAGAGGLMSPAFRPPAVPLVTVDPYTSCWSMGDELSAGWPRHWTGAVHAMLGLVRVDGQVYRWMGDDRKSSRRARQISLDVRATQTEYRFLAGGAELTVTFTSPLLPDDLDVLSRPASYVTMAVRSADGSPHAVDLYFDATAEWAVHQPGQAVVWSRAKTPGLQTMRIGTKTQPILARKGDNVRIDWGYLYVSAPDAAKARTAIASDAVARGAFLAGKDLPAKDDTAMPRACNKDWPVMAVAMPLGRVGAQTIERHVIVAYDDITSIVYFNKRLKAWWRRGKDATPEKMLVQAEQDYSSLRKRCDAFDRGLAVRTRKAGGQEYADLCQLVYRQAVAAHKLVDRGDGTPLFFSKECFSNGSIGTVDVTYPSAPMFLIYNPTLLKGMMEPIFDYVKSGNWSKPFAPHDVGTYPIANGQTYPRDMPVEECGNMIVLAGAIAAVEGKADYAKKHWKALTTWAEYLKAKGFDPDTQLCTDDFAGHLAHNANLSVKAIVALACYAKMADMLGEKASAQAYRGVAEEYVAKWTQAAADGDHYSLTFDKKGTWSQKYNLVWDKVLDLGLFPPEVARKEVRHYLKVQNRFGLPLDSRAEYTKSDWILWSATLAESRADFRRLMLGVWRFASETPTRVPCSDWHWSHSGKVRGFRARSVVGGYYMKMLADELAGRRK